MLGEATLLNLKEAGVEVVTHAVPSHLTRDDKAALTLEVTDRRRLGPFDALVWAIGAHARGGGARAVLRRRRPR